MASANFDDIFAPGKFDEENNRYRREFPGFEAGGRRNTLAFDTLKEHLERNGGGHEPLPNGNSKNMEWSNSKMEFEVQNFSDGRTVLKIDFDDDIGDQEAYMRNSVDQWLGEIFRREQKVYSAATRFVHDYVPEKAEEEGLTEEEVLEQELDFDGEGLLQFHEDYRNGGPPGLALVYGSEFELLPFQDFEWDRSDLPGRMPIADEDRDPDLKARNDLYQRKYLEAVVEEAAQHYDVSDDLREDWVDYVGATYD